MTSRSSAEIVMVIVDFFLDHRSQQMSKIVELTYAHTVCAEKLGWILPQIGVHQKELALCGCFMTKWMHP